MGNALRGLNMPVLADAAIKTWFAMETKLFLAAWLLIGNLRMEEAYRCLVLMSSTPKSAAREDLWAAFSELADESAISRQPGVWRRMLHDIIPARPAEFRSETLLARTEMLRGCDYARLASILDGKHPAEYPVQEVKITSGKVVYLLHFHDAGLVFNIIRARLKTEPITADVLHKTHMGAMHRYGKHYPTDCHKIMANELTKEMRAQVEEQSAKKPRLDCAAQPNADTMTETKSQEVAVTPSGSASVASSSSPPTQAPA